MGRIAGCVVVGFLVAGCHPGGSAGDGSPLADGEAGVASRCRSDRECSSRGLVCDTVGGACVECVVPSDCLHAGEVCLAHRCTQPVACVSSRMCPGQVCDTTFGYCVDCVTSTDCTNGQVCRGSACEDPPPACTSNDTCTALGMVCDTVAGRCAQCLVDHDCGGQLHCGADHTCGPRPPQQSCLENGTPGCGVVPISGGQFAQGAVGSSEGEPVQGNITVGDFVMDAYEVTVARFRRYWAAGHPGLTAPVSYPGGMVAWSGTPAEPSTTLSPCNWTPTAGAREAHPINCVDWGTALAFCVWDGGRLPTEAEWEWAARGRAVPGLSTVRKYPWGDQDPVGSTTIPCDRAQWNNCVGDDGASTRRVGSFAASGGIYDLAGNIHEWMADTYRAYTDSACWAGVPRTNPVCRPPDGSDVVVVRGGSWRADQAIYLQSASRGHTATAYSNIGFRCIASR